MSTVEGTVKALDLLSECEKEIKNRWYLSGEELIKYKKLRTIAQAISDLAFETNNEMHDVLNALSNIIDPLEKEEIGRTIDRQEHGVIN